MRMKQKNVAIQEGLEMELTKLTDEIKGCLKELKRLKKHYKDEPKHPYCFGIVDGLDMAIDILKHKDYYGDK